VNSRGVARGVCTLAMCCAVSTNAWAQREGGPYSRLFDGGRDAEARRTLTLRWAGYGSYDDTGRDRSLEPAGDSRFHDSGLYGGLSVGLDFAQSVGRPRFRVEGGTAVRAYRSTGISAPAYITSAGFDLAPTRRTAIRTSVGVGYSSFYQFAPFLSEDPFAGGDIPTYDYAASHQQNVTTSAAIGLTQQLSSRMSLSTDTSWNRMRFKSSDADAVGLDTRTASFRFQGSVARDLGFHAGYGYQGGQVGNLPAEYAPAVVHDLDIGVDYNRALSVSRRTTLQFGTGSSIAQSYQRIWHYRLNGQASLNHEFRRTWTASLSYLRGTQFVHGLNDVVFSDAVNAGLAGQLATRLQLVFRAGYSAGQVGLGTDDPGFSSSTVSGRAVYGLTRAIGMYAQYTYYHYHLPQASSAFGALPPRLGRQTLTFGLNGMLPFMKDARSSRDSR